jgi:hypothetical protein
MKILVCILAITAIVLIGTVAAAPVLPGEYYGSVYMNGNPAPVGTEIIAKINGEQRGELITTKEGLYGSPDNFEPRLMVTSTEEEINSGNITISFFVGGIQAFQIVPFSSGNSEKLDLIANGKAFATATTTVTPTYATSGGSSGSSGGSSYVSGGSVPLSSGTGSSATTGNAMQGTTGTATPTTDNRSSIYYNIDATQTPPIKTVLATTSSTPSPAVTTVSTTKKAGMGPYSMIFLIASIIAMFGIISRSNNFRNRK